MKLHSVQTSIGAATLADLSHHPQHPIENLPGWGLIFWGCCDRVTFGTIACNSTAEWIADYSANDKCAIVIYSERGDLKIGSRVMFDSTCADAVCPNCGSTQYTRSGINWRCKNCDRQWRQNPKPRGGKRVGAGRKVLPKD